MTQAKVLLLEDDATFHKFVADALSPLRVELNTVHSIEAAFAALSKAAFVLVLMDQRCVEATGNTLMQHLRTEASLTGLPRVAVYGDALTPAINAGLSQRGVWRLLPRTASVDQLQQCLRDAIAVRTDRSVVVPRRVPADVIDYYFGGNVRLYWVYREACEQQFPIDLAEGDRAVSALSISAMRGLGHTLKSVLLMLGEREAAAAAKAIDVACVEADWLAVLQQWPILRTALSRLIADKSN